MALDMCPCMPLQRGVELLAIIDAVLSVITVGLFLLALAIVGAMAFTEELGLSDGEKIVAVVAVLLVIAILAVQVFMAVQLYYGAKTKDYGKCRRWFVFTVIMLLLNFYGILKKGSDMDNVSFRLFLVELIYRVYELFVVIAFMRRITQERIPSVAVVFTNQEVPSQIYTTQNSNQYVYTSLSVEPQQFNQLQPLQSGKKLGV